APHAARLRRRGALAAERGGLRVEPRPGQERVRDGEPRWHAVRPGRGRARARPRAQRGCGARGPARARRSVTMSVLYRAALALVLVTGCATMIRGTRQRIPVRSTPA